MGYPETKNPNLPNDTEHKSVGNPSSREEEPETYIEYSQTTISPALQQLAKELGYRTDQ